MMFPCVVIDIYQYFDFKINDFAVKKREKKYREMVSFNQISFEIVYTHTPTHQTYIHPPDRQKTLTNLCN